MTARIESLSVRGFRSLRELSIEGLGRVNLFTGKNNSGKTSLLEAIRILVSGGSPRVMYEVLESREELGMSQRVDASEFDMSVRNLFSGYPITPGTSEGFGLEARGSLPGAIRSLEVRWTFANRVFDAETQSSRFEIAPEGDLFGDSDTVPVVEIITPQRRRVLPVQRIPESRVSRLAIPEYTETPCVYLNPFSSRSSAQMSALWDAVALTDLEDEIVQALRVIAPEVIAVSMIGESSRKGRIAIAKSIKHASPLPLRSFGDGVNRIFSTILSLANARNGILLTDEIENGIHYTAQEEFWRIIFKLAAQLNVQVFATSHSWDCISAFQRAAKESSEEGVLIRLRQENGYVNYTSFTEEELEIVTRDRIEVR
jgi:energy-coupling factor transporter ATP-binding protein EcfA2